MAADLRRRIPGLGALRGHVRGVRPVDRHGRLEPLGERPPPARLQPGTNQHLFLPRIEFGLRGILVFPQARGTRRPDGVALDRRGGVAHSPGTSIARPAASDPPPSLLSPGRPALPRRAGLPFVPALETDGGCLPRRFAHRLPALRARLRIPGPGDQFHEHDRWLLDDAGLRAGDDPSHVAHRPGGVDAHAHLADAPAQARRRLRAAHRPARGRTRRPLPPRPVRIRFAPVLPPVRGARGRRSLTGE